MPLFSYKAKDKKGKIIEDVLQATNRSEAVSILKSESLQLLTLKSLKSGLGAIVGGSVSVADKAAFCRFMATMLRAGLALPEAVDIIGKETENKRLKKILIDVSFQTRRGSSISVVLSKYPKDFDPVFLTMIKAGEESGTLDKAFDYLAKQLLAAHEMSQKVKGAMIYPAVIVVAMFANAIVMITFVLPKISEVFTKLNLKLPPTTRLILGTGQFVGDHTPLVIFAIIFFTILTVLFFVIKKTRNIIFTLLTKTPVVKRLINQIDVSRFARTFSTLLRSAVPVLVALDVSADALSQPKVKEVAKGFSALVAKGESFSDVLLRHKNLFPPVMVQTVRAGEKSGSLEDVLEELADFYEKEVDYSLKRLTSVIEPVLMLVIGVAVGAMVVMMITPIYSIVGGLEGSF